MRVRERDREVRRLGSPHNAAQVGERRLDRAPFVDVVDAALDHDRVGSRRAALEALEDLIGALTRHAAVAEPQVRVLPLRPVLPLAPGIVAEVEDRADPRIRLVAGAARRDRVAEGDHQVAVASVAAAARAATPGGEDQGGGRERGRRCDRTSGVHPGELAAGDVDHLPVDEVGELGAEEEDRARPRPRARPGGRAGSSAGPSGAAAPGSPARPARRSPRRPPSSRPSPSPGSGASRRSRRRPRCELTLNCPHSLAMVLVRPVTPGLGGGVVRLAGVAHGARDRGDVDDLAEPSSPASASFFAASRQLGARARITRKGTIVWMSSIA